MQYCSLQHWTLLLSPVTSTTRCCFSISIHSFFLELFIPWSPVAYGHLPTWGVPLSVSYHFAFSYCSWGSQGKKTEVASIPFSSGVCPTSPPWPGCLGWPHTAWLGVTELDRTVVLGSDWLVFCDYGFIVSALWCPLGHLRLTWLSLTSDVRCLLTAAPPDFECGVALLAAPAPSQPAALGRRLWPWAAGSSSRPGFCTVRRSWHRYSNLESPYSRS